MIKVEVESWDDLNFVRRKLGKFKDDAPKVLRNAINTTATQARRRLAETAQKTYTVKNAGFNRHTKIQRATTSELTAYIRVNGKPLSQPRYHTVAPKSGAKTEVIKGSGLKPLINSKGNKAFKSKVATGIKNVKAGKTRKFMGLSVTPVKQTEKTANMILQRVGKERYPLRSFHGPAVSKMIEKVYKGGKITNRGLQEEIQKAYRANVDAAIAKALGGGKV